MKKLLALVLMLTFALVLVGCGGKDLTPTDIAITGPKEVAVGVTIQLSATVAPEGVAQTVTWSSSNPAIAAVDATGKVTGVAGGGAVIKAKSTVNDVEKTHAIQVKAAAEVIQYPDLGGYTIKIAHSVPAESDPFSVEYTQNDKLARQQAWTEVEDLYNVKFVVETFDEEYAWGPPRWNYLIDQAAQNTSDYDFVSVPDDKIGLLVEGGALLDTAGWYSAYGKGFLDPTYQNSGTYKGKLYSIIDGEAGLNNVMYYNANLVQQLIDAKHLEKTPAQIFNEGNWDYDAFVDYAIKSQEGLNSIFADRLDEEGFETKAVSGYSMYYWVGMANAGGVGLVNPSNLTVHFTDSIPEQAAQHLKEIADAGAMKLERTVDGVAFTSMHNPFTKGTGIFDTGDMWFIGTTVRWPRNMWGEGDLTKFGYVPFPRPNGTTKETHRVAMGGTATYVMPIGRDSEYAKITAAGTEVTAENVYRAFTHTFLRTKEIRDADPNNDREAARLEYADKFTDTDDSKEALLYIFDNMDTIAFFDPWSLPTNPVGNTYGDAIGTAFHGYVVGTGAKTFAEAVEPHVGRLQESLTKAYS